MLRLRWSCLNERKSHDIQNSEEYQKRREEQKNKLIDELKTRGKDLLLSLTNEERSYVTRLLEESCYTDDRVLWQTIHEIDYVRTPPTPEEFLEDDYYMNTVTRDLFPYWREAFLECTDPTKSIRTIISTGPIGAGKTVFSILLLLYKIACTACLRDPQGFYHQMMGTTLTYGIYAVTKDNVQLGSYKKCISFLKLSPFFKEIYNVKDDRDYKGLLVEFPGNVNLRAGSTELHALSQDIISVLLEEVNFRIEKDPVKAAYDLLNATERRIESRFMREGGFIPGAVIINSSKKYQTDFLDDYINKVGSEPWCRVYDAPIWRIKGVFPGMEKMSENQIRFSGETFKVDPGSDTRDSKIIEDSESIPDDTDIIEVPVEYKPRFELDLAGSLQDIAGVSTSRLSRLFSSVEEFRRCYDNSIPNPIKKQDIPLVLSNHYTLQDFFDFNSYFIRRHSVWQPRDNPGAPRYAHVDLSKNKDATGIGVSHVCNFRGVDAITHEGIPINIVLPVVRMDFVIRIVSTDGDRIDYSKIRSFFAWLNSHGVQFKLITFDDYQSTDSQNILQKMGFNTGYLSLDRSSKGEQASLKYKSPYIVWKNAVIEGRVRMHPYPYLEKEALHLINYENKIDHPEKFRDGSRGCFVGDTTVNLLDGRVLSFELLTKEFSDPNEVFYVYSVDKDNNIVVGEAYHPRITKYVTKLVEVTLDNGRQMRCTVDHLWMNRDGTYIEAKDLEVGTSLMPFYRKVESSTRLLRRKKQKFRRDRKPGMVFRRDTINKDRGYERVYSPGEGKWRFTHRIVAKWKYPNKDIYWVGSNKNKGAVHHSSGRLNNHPDNIVWFDDKRLHFKMHADDIKNKRSDPEFERKRQEGLRRFNNNSKNRQAQSRRMKLILSDPAFHKDHIERGRRLGKMWGTINITKYNKSNKHREVARRIGKITGPINIKNAHTPEAIARTIKRNKERSGSNHPDWVDVTFEDIVKVAKKHKFTRDLLLELGITRKVFTRRIKTKGYNEGEFKKKFMVARTRRDYPLSSNIELEDFIVEAKNHTTIISMCEALGVTDQLFRRRVIEAGISTKNFINTYLRKKVHPDRSVTIDQILDAKKEGLKDVRSIASKLGVSRSSIKRVIRENSVKKPKELLNHKVSSVRIISLSKPVPVYDLTVKKHSNFCIGSSVFVHNSKDMSDASAGSVYNCLNDQKEMPHDDVELQAMAQQKYEAQESMSSIMGFDKTVGKEQIDKLNQWMTKDYEAELDQVGHDAEDDVLTIDQTGDD